MNSKAKLDLFMELNQVAQRVELLPEKFNTEVVLETIFAFLDVKAVKQCRLVCRIWSDVATNLLIKRKVCVKNAALDGEVVENNFKELTRLAEVSGKFPCVGVRLDHLWILHAPAVREFFRENGKKIRFVKVSNGKIRSKYFVRFLSKQLPNLEEIYIERLGLVNVSKNQFFPKIHPSQPLELSALKIITLDPYLPINEQDQFEKLLLLAKNLKLINNFDIRLTQAVVRTNKIHTIQACRLKIPDSMVDVTKFSSALPALRTLEVEENIRFDFSQRIKEEASPALSSILESSKNSLVSLRINANALDIVSNVRFPVLWKVTKLVLCFNERHCERLVATQGSLGFFGVFPNNMLLSKTFPNLREVQVKGHIEGAFTFPSSSANDKVPSVHILESMCPYDAHGLNLLHSYFPNISKLVMDWPSWFRHGGQNLIWRVPFQLKALEMYDVRLSLQSSLLPVDLDSFFTGFPKEVCRIIRKSCDFTNPTLNFTQGPSLTDLKSLEELKIRLSSTPVRSKDHLTFSEVSGFFAFSKLPLLKVLILCNFQNMGHEIVPALRPLSPYVTFMNAGWECFRIS